MTTQIQSIENRSIHRLWRWALLAALLSGCQSSNVIVDYNPATPFSHYRYYRWVEPVSLGEEPPAVLKPEEIHRAVNQQLGLAGYAPSEEPQTDDFLVRVRLVLTIETTPPTTSVGIGLGHHGNHSGFGVSLKLPLGEEQVYHQGQLMIDILETKEQRLVWRGTKAIRLRQGEVLIHDALQEWVAEILANFPPKPSH